MIAAFGLTSCSNTDSPTDPDPDKPGNGDELETWLTATIVWPDGNESEFSISYTTADPVVSGKYNVNYSDAETSGYSQIALDFEENDQKLEIVVDDDEEGGIKSGEYPFLDKGFVSGGSYIGLTDANGIEYSSHGLEFISDDGKVTIKAIDDRHVEGTFSATLINDDNPDEVIEIKDGAFYGYYNTVYVLGR